MPPPGMHYDTDTLRQFCDIWEKHGSGLIAFHGQSGDIMFQGATTENVQKAFDEINDMGFDLGGAGPAVRTSMSCVGAARCEQSCYDEAKAHREVLNTFLDDIHRPALPYKFKFKFSGCPNDCMNSIQRSDMAVIGTWRDNIRTDDALAKKWFAKHGMNELVNDVVARCPTKAIQIKEIKDVRKDDHICSVALNDTQALEIDNKDCVRCMHCINVMTGALATGKDKGATVLIGGKSTLKIGDLMGTVVIPFMKLETDEDYEKLVELGQKIIDFFAENALEHERTGEMIERIGLVNFLEGIEARHRRQHGVDAAHESLRQYRSAGTKKSPRSTPKKLLPEEIASMNAPATTTAPAAPLRKAIECGVPDNKPHLHPTMLKNYGNWKYHDRPRPGVLHHVSHSGDEIWTVRAGTQRQMDV